MVDEFYRPVHKVLAQTLRFLRLHTFMTLDDAPVNGFCTCPDHSPHTVLSILQSVNGRPLTFKVLYEIPHKSSGLGGISYWFAYNSAYMHMHSYLW